MRTVKVIKKEAEEALKKYNNHSDNCSVCGSIFEIGDYQEENTCRIADSLYDIYDELRQQIEYYEELFQAELKDRNLAE